jgi:hypothetical protein
VRWKHFLGRAEFCSAPGKVPRADFDSIIGQVKGANPIRMGHAPRFQHKQPALAFAIIFQIAQANPGIDQGRNAYNGLIRGIVF